VAGEIHGAAARPAPRPRVPLPPAPAGPELDDREVPCDREPDGPPLAGGEGDRRRERGSAGSSGWLRFIGTAVEPPVGREVRPQVAVGDRIEPGAPRDLNAVAGERGDGERSAKGGRCVCARVAELHGDRAVVGDDPMRPGRGGTGRREWIGPGEQEPDRHRVGPRVLEPPLENPDRQGAPLEVAGDDRRELLADDADPAGDVGFERLPRPREERVVRPAADRERPAPIRQLARPQRAQHGRPRAGWAADEQREPVRGDRLVAVSTHFQVPARRVAAIGPTDAAGSEPADRHSGELTVVEDRLGDSGPPDRRARHADPSAPRLARDRRPLDRPLADSVAVGDRHFSIPVTTTPRMNARWARTKTTRGTAIVIRADAWISVGWVE